ncbi:MAG: response regulator transcription factor [Anaerolineales bacterium]|nr:response regulator transcription factor [Anaerolineales bacterium]
MMYPIKVFIIDDDFYVRQATTSLLTRDERTEVVGSASSIAEAMTELDALMPDIILLDLDFKHTRESGLEAVVPLKNLLPKTGILIFSASRDENSILEAMQAGADGYIWKNDAAEGLGSAIERVKDGSFVITESIARLIYGKFSGLIDERPAEILPESKRFVDLTKRVEQVMRLFCFEGMSALEIAETLHLSENTVRGYIKAGYEVVGATTRREAFQKLIARADE